MSKKFKIGTVQFGEPKTVIIAEAGVNHLGSIDNGRKLIEAAKRAGADIVKFQTYKAEKLTTRNAPRFWDWEGEVNSSGSQFDSYSLLDEFGFDEHKALKQICDEVGIEFLSTPFDDDSVDMLLKIGVQGFKMASCDLTNYGLLEHVASTKLPILLSTGASSLEEIHESVEFIRQAGCDELLLLHCTLSYPTKTKDSNLLAIQTLQRAFPDLLIGLSDHTLGPLIGASSVLLGACAIEKHFTFDKTLPLSADHWLSADEDELALMISMVRDFELARGSGEKIVLQSEELARQNARRSLVAKYSMKRGEVIQTDSLIAKRPGTGISPHKIKEVIGRKLTTDVSADELITWELLK